MRPILSGTIRTVRQLTLCLYPKSHGKGFAEMKDYELLTRPNERRESMRKAVVGVIMRKAASLTGAKLPIAFLCYDIQCLNEARKVLLENSYLSST